MANSIYMYVGYLKKVLIAFTKPNLSVTYLYAIAKSTYDRDINFIFLTN